MLGIELRSFFEFSCRFFNNAHAFSNILILDLPDVACI
jgi:hypothetical protein